MILLARSRYFFSLSARSPAAFFSSVMSSSARTIPDPVLLPSRKVALTSTSKAVPSLRVRRASTDPVPFCSICERSSSCTRCGSSSSLKRIPGLCPSSSAPVYPVISWNRVLVHPNRSWEDMTPSPTGATRKIPASRASCSASSSCVLRSWRFWDSNSSLVDSSSSMVAWSSSLAATSSSFFRPTSSSARTRAVISLMISRTPLKRPSTNTGLPDTLSQINPPDFAYTRYTPSRVSPFMAPWNISSAT